MARIERDNVTKITRGTAGRPRPELESTTALNVGRAVAPQATACGWWRAGGRHEGDPHRRRVGQRVPARPRHSLCSRNTRTPMTVRRTLLGLRCKATKQEARRVDRAARSWRERSGAQAAALSGAAPAGAMGGRSCGNAGFRRTSPSTWMTSSSVDPAQMAACTTASARRRSM